MNIGSSFPSYLKRFVYNPSRKREELPMSEEALRGWYWAGVIVSGLALWVVWYILVYVA
jgi:hypothetical protein